MSPDAKTLIRLARLLDEPVLKDVLARLVALGRERRVVRGRRLRVDTTVVENRRRDRVAASLELRSEIRGKGLVIQYPREPRLSFCSSSEGVAA